MRKNRKQELNTEEETQTGFFHRPGVRRVTAWLMILLLLSPLLLRLYGLYMANSTRIVPDHNNGSFVATKLEAELSRPGCFYDSAGERYVFPGLSFGQGLEETVDALGLQDWYTEERMQDTLNSFDEQTGFVVIHPRNYVNVNCFDAVYTLTNTYTPDRKCFSAELAAHIFINDYHPKGIYEFNNSMSYAEACGYLSNLYREFLAAYGTPQEASFPVELERLTAENITASEEGTPNYAYWVAGDAGDRSVLQMKYSVYRLSDGHGNAGLFFNVEITVEQEREGISFDDPSHPQTTFFMENIGLKTSRSG